MTTVADSFNRADNACSLGVADSGQVWAVPTATAVFGIIGNRSAFMSGPGAGVFSVAVVSSLSTDRTVSVDVTTVPGAQTGGLVFRCTDDANYWLYLFQGSGLFKKVAGSFVQVQASGPSGIGTYSAVLRGNSITIRKNGVDAFTVTDSFNSGASLDGFSVSGDTTQRFDNFTVTDDSPWGVPFLTRTSSGAVSCTGQSNIVISGKQFTGIGNDISAIRITNCNNVLITACDFKDCCQPVTIYNSTNIEISWCRYQNITGPHARNGSNRGNFTQWVSCTGGWIHDNKGIAGDTEDIINTYQSGGVDATHPLIIERNAFEGTNWTSTSGSGILLGDVGGSHIVARNNTLLNPGQVGIGIAGGTDIHVTDNTIYGTQRPSSNVGIYVWNQGSGSCSGHELSLNTVEWFRADGVQNPGWDAGNCGPITGINTNNWYATIDPATLHVTL